MSSPTYDYGPDGPNALPYQQADTSYPSEEPEYGPALPETASSTTSYPSAPPETGSSTTDGYYGQEGLPQQGLSGYSLPEEEQADPAAQYPQDGDGSNGAIYYGPEDPAQPQDAEEPFDLSPQAAEGMPYENPTSTGFGFGFEDPTSTGLGDPDGIDLGDSTSTGFGDSTSTDFGAGTSDTELETTDSGVDTDPNDIPYGY
jgi:hypothetical protein